MGELNRVRLHRNDHGHRYHTCHHERCQTAPVAHHLLKALRTPASRSREEPRRLTIAQARIA